MERSEFERRKNELSIQFLTEKREGKIAEATPWAVWCHDKGIYPLTSFAPVTNPPEIDPRNP